MYIINTIPHGKCFVQYLRTRCFCIRNRTSERSERVRFLIRQQLVRKYRTPALSMKYSLYQHNPKCGGQVATAEFSSSSNSRYFPSSWFILPHVVLLLLPCFAFRDPFLECSGNFRARRAVLCLLWRVCIQDQNVNNFENDTMKLSVDEAQWLVCDPGNVLQLNRFRF